MIVNYLSRPYVIHFVLFIVATCELRATYLQKYDKSEKCLSTVKFEQLIRIFKIRAKENVD